jgi:hypothetical protein
MVARINTSGDLGRVLGYNEKKVAQNKAELLSARNFLQEKNRLTPAEKFQRFQHLNELNPRSDINTLHISLNFQPTEKLTDTQLTTIADRYMQGLRLDHQPYLVYRHDDAQHPHLHIVSSLIQPDGRRVQTNYIGARLSEPTRKAIEAEFNLAPIRGKKQSPGHDEADGTLRQAIETVNRDYRFSNLDEYNALLRQHRVLADPGSPNSRTRKHGGLLYHALDDQGNRVGVPVKASLLPNKPTLRSLQEKFNESAIQHPQDLQAIRRKVDWARLQNPNDLPALLADLHEARVDVLIHRQHHQDTIIYIDHDRKTAITGDQLGKAYTTEGLQALTSGKNLNPRKDLSPLPTRTQPPQTQQPAQPPQLPAGEQPPSPAAQPVQPPQPTQAPPPIPAQPPPTDLNLKVSQLLSQFLSSGKPSGSSIDIEQDQDLRPRRRPQ